MIGGGIKRSRKTDSTWLGWAHWLGYGEHNHTRQTNRVGYLPFARAGVGSDEKKHLIDTREESNVHSAHASRLFGGSPDDADDACNASTNVTERVTGVGASTQGLCTSNHGKTAQAAKPRKGVANAHPWLACGNHEWRRLARNKTFAEDAVEQKVKQLASNKTSQHDPISLADRKCGEKYVTWMQCSSSKKGIVMPKIHVWTELQVGLIFCVVSLPSDVACQRQV